MFTVSETFNMSGLALVAQGRPGARDGHSSYAEGCAAAQLLPPSVDRVALDKLQYSLADDAGVAEYFEAAGHDPRVVCRLQRAHDVAVLRTRTNTVTWCKSWLIEVVEAAADLGVSPNQVLQAARNAGWTDVPSDIKSE